MAQENLMRELPKGYERVSEDGSFFIRNNGGSWSVVVLTEDLVTCGGEDGKDRATHLAGSLNKTWSQQIRRSAKAP